MASVRSIAAALSLAALLGVAAVQPAAAQSSSSSNTLTINTISAVGTTITIYGTASTDGFFSSGITLDPLYDYVALSGFSPTYKNLVGESTPYTGWLATYNIPSNTPGYFIGQLSFDSMKTSGFGVIPNGGAQAVFVVSAVPEPGAVAFGVIAAGSVLGLAVRRRKVA